MGVDKNNSNKTLKDCFLKVNLQVDQLSKQNYFPIVSSNALYDIPFCGTESLLLYIAKKQKFKCFFKCWRLTFVKNMFFFVAYARDCYIGALIWD